MQGARPVVSEQDSPATRDGYNRYLELISLEFARKVGSSGIAFFIGYNVERNRLKYFGVKGVTQPCTNQLISQIKKADFEKTNESISDGVMSHEYYKISLEEGLSWFIVSYEASGTRFSYGVSDF